MKNRAYLYLFLYFIIAAIKIPILAYFILNGIDLFGGAGDSNYYHDFALGYVDDVPNVWPLLLRLLNEIGLYSRTGIAFFLSFLALIIIPILIANLAYVQGAPTRSRTFWFSAFFWGISPTFFFYGLDINRDIFMVFVFLLGVFFARLYYEKNKITLIFFCAISIGIFLCYLRPYLGIAYLVAILMGGFYSFKKYHFLSSLILYLLSINFLFYLGFFNSLITYREIFFNGGADGGTNFGIIFDSPYTFLIKFLQNFFYQVIGIKIYNLSSIFIFVWEGVPFSAMLFYVIYNRQYSSKIVDFLIVFFVCYSTVFLLSNDNLGTAVRLRIYSHIAIFISCMIIMQRKAYISQLTFPPKPRP